MRYAAVKKLDISNGPGVRLSIYLQGCPHQCSGCFNPETWDEDGGIEVDLDLFISELKSEIEQNKSLYQGISILGGEPLTIGNVQTTLQIINGLREFNLPVWVWTGYTFDDLLVCINDELYGSRTSTLVDVLSSINCLVDGPFEEDEYNINLVHYGSANQSLVSKLAIKQGLESILGE